MQSLCNCAIAVQLRNRCAIAVQSLRNLCAISAQSLCNRCAIAVQSLCNRCATSQSLCNCAIAVQSLCNRFLTAQSLCIRCTVTPQSLRNLCPISLIILQSFHDHFAIITQSLHFTFKLGRFVPHLHALPRHRDRSARQNRSGATAKCRHH
jgi:hypothetical protein